VLLNDKKNMRYKQATRSHIPPPLTCALWTLCLLSSPGTAIAQLSDPMAPPGTLSITQPESSRANPTSSDLRGIVSGPDRHLALINGNVVHEGQSIPGDGELISIGADSATIRSGDQYIQLRLHPDPRMKKEASSR